MDSHTNTNAPYWHNLYPNFHRDEHGNIIARYANGNRVTVIRAHHRTADSNSNSDSDSQQTDETADSGDADRGAV